MVKEWEEGCGGASNKETARRHNTRRETSQERVFILCCDKAKVEHLEKHIYWGRGEVGGNKTRSERRRRI